MSKPSVPYILFLLLLLVFTGYSQSSYEIKAHLLPNTHQINIEHKLVFHNQSNDTLNEIYFYDWNNSFSNKNTALAKRFGEEFNKNLHLAKREDRGITNIRSINDSNFDYLDWERMPSGDIIRVQLKYPVYPGKEYTLQLFYVIKLPNSSFTGYGFTDDGDFNLRYWYMMPAIYDHGWKLYSNKNLYDVNPRHRRVRIEFTYPESYMMFSDLDLVEKNEENLYTRETVTGKDRGDIKLFFRKKGQGNFSIFRNNKMELITDLSSKNISLVTRAVSSEKVIDFINEELGSYPHEKLLVSEIDYKNNPLYGLNQLPSFLRPFPEEFQYELKLLKTTLGSYLESSLFMNNRKEKWVTDGIQTYLMMKFVEKYYPDMKLLGNLSDSFLLRGFHFAKMDFNDQYPFLYMLMVRRNQDQPLVTPTDELVKFNLEIANKYKAGVGLSYLDHYLGEDYISERLKAYYNQFKGNYTTAMDFENVLQAFPSKNIDWFFDSYVNSNKRIDFKIKDYAREGDSLLVSIKNKTGNDVPMTLFGIDDENHITFKKWITNVEPEKTIMVPSENVKKLALNYDKVIPEMNQRDNWKTTSGFFSTNKRLKFEFMKDIEDPDYYQIFYVPVFRYNIYDGFTPGIRLHNKTFLERPFIYDLQPSYALKEKAITGSGRLNFKRYFQEGNMYYINAGLTGSSFHYAQNLRYSTITPSLTFGFRNKDLRSNEREFLSLRFVNVIRQYSPSIDTDPDYSVFNARYIYSNNGIINYKAWFTDVQVTSSFAKISLNWEYRRLFENNRQFNLRFFAGKFIYNETNSDFFSFALDRPTDYLFDYDYFGRSESSGLWSQQLIVAEGGFKSKLDTPYSNDWIATANTSFNLWRWIELYGDIGVIRNKNENAKFVYDSGIRLNLVTDYFELYFPVYSNNGWEIAQPGYDERIRFIVTLSPRTLTGLFTRKWF
ncbi:M1 family metallopeptidase [Robertkochia solimangrovi]|uniref:M1 family metallopeptidase n=1 Tax=Robertkochia solimangrovi TaxID=2213046 RepID=UPI00118037F7|nr:M1 family metallopeptidase [Robertkochia solimangrovi]TRZ45210.1 metalloprotease [Robertkochia solimangrovi]